MQETLVHITTRKLINGAIGTLDADVVERDVRTRGVAAALDVAGDGAVFAARGAVHVLDQDVGNRQIRWELVAQRQVLLPVALGDFDGVVGVLHAHGVVGDVVDSSGATAALEVAGESGG